MRRNVTLGAVTDYDILVIDGVKYTSREIVDKQLIAAKDTPVYHSDLVTLFRTVKAGQPLGKVYSYLKASAARPVSALMLYDNPLYTGTPYYLRLDSTGAIDRSFLKDQGAVTVQEQIKQDQAQAEKEADPLAYYFKKLAIPVLLTAAGIYVAVQFGKEYIKDKVHG